jgi:saccharopine dehydrogenase-like NADP-dependent oxidoreductase
MTEQREKYSVFVAGAGGIGQAVGLLLREWASFEVDLYLADTNLLAAQEACDFIKKFSTKETTVEAVLMPATGTNESLDSVLDKCEVVLDCAPGSKAPEIARLALDHSCHYANLTEYVVS